MPKGTQKKVQSPTAPMPVPPKTDRQMFIKTPAPVPGSDIGKPKHGIPARG